ncbi:MAG: amino acid-binding protein [Deltaproteobacteria bacterium]|nr:MAG: amino acid-binding protein [Deltaproteobacteria bacterium]
MALKQISIFLENSPGRLLDVTKALGKAGINLRALSLADTAGFGVLRLLVSDAAAARKVAMEKHWPARVDDVIAIKIPDTPGSLAEILEPLRKAKVDVEYMYAFTGFSTHQAVMIFGFKDVKRAKEVLAESGAELLNASQFAKLSEEG